MSDTTLKHAKVVRRTPKEDGTVLVEKEGYYEELNSIEESIEQSIITSKTTFITDLMRCISPISDGTSRRVTVTIEANERNEPTRIVKTWLIRKEYYGR
jgi:hypothetical protein